MISFKIASTQIFMTEIFNIYISGTWSFTMFRIYIYVKQLFADQSQNHSEDRSGVMFRKFPSQRVGSDQHNIATCGERQTQYLNFTRPFFIYHVVDGTNSIRKSARVKTKGVTPPHISHLTVLTFV